MRINQERRDEEAKKQGMKGVRRNKRSWRGKTGLRKKNDKTKNKTKQRIREVKSKAKNWKGSMWEIE